MYWLSPPPHTLHLLIWVGWGGVGWGGVGRWAFAKGVCQPTRFSEDDFKAQYWQAMINLWYHKGFKDLVWSREHVADKKYVINACFYACACYTRSQ